MRGPAVTLGENERQTVLVAAREVCEYQHWTLHAVHVRLTHVHVVASGDVAPESMLGKLKAYSSRALNLQGGRREKRWAHHGSTIYLWGPADVHDAVEYVYARQGAPMARYVDPLMWPQFLLND
jgi:REP element-mobilizing transposase RayT